MAQASPQDDLAANLAALVADLRKGRAIIVFRQVFDADADEPEHRYGRPPRLEVSIERREP